MGGRFFAVEVTRKFEMPGADGKKKDDDLQRHGH